MTIDEMIDILQAHKDGVELQSCDADDSTMWSASPYPTFNFSAMKYRRKPKEPRTFWIWLGDPPDVHGSQSGVIYGFETPNTIKVVEVL